MSLLQWIILKEEIIFLHFENYTKKPCFNCKTDEPYDNIEGFISNKTFEASYPINCNKIVSDLL